MLMIFLLNRALGLGATRGRLYIKHPDIFKVTCLRISSNPNGKDET